MGSKYICVGNAVIDHIIPYGSDNVSAIRLGGGGIFASEGMKLWEDSVEFASCTGHDFDELYGDLLSNTEIVHNHMDYIFSRTRTMDIRYTEDGTFVSADHYDEHRLNQMWITADFLEKAINKDTKGIHIIARIFPDEKPMNDHFRKIYELCKEQNITVGYEYEPSPTYYREDTKEVFDDLISYCDFYSINHHEAKRMFPAADTIEHALEFLSQYDKPCFFRVGTKGAYMIMNHNAHYCPMLDDFGTKDSTGCGNSSTAAAFHAFCEGLSPEEISYRAGITAALCASYSGLITEITYETKKKCRILLNHYITEDQNG